MMYNTEQLITLHTMIQQLFTAHKDIIVLLTCAGPCIIVIPEE